MAVLAPPAVEFGTATLEDLMRVDGKAELINGRIVEEMATGDEPSYAALEITFALRQYARRVGRGRAVGDNAGFRVDNLPHRQSFSPDAAYYTGPRSGHGFFPQPPDFAVEVRSENDYGIRAEHALREKRADYFAAGTLVVWDVALLSDDAVTVYRADQPETPTTYRRGDVADAEPAVPGWTMPVDDLFDE